MRSQAEGLYVAGGLGEIIGGGLHSEVRRAEDGWVEKTIRFPYSHMFWDLAGKLQADYDMLKKYIHRIPATVILRSGGKVTTKQREVQDADPMYEYSLEELIGNPRTRQDLDEITGGIERMFYNEWRLPDVHGYRQYDIMTTDNILIERQSGAAWFVDVDMVGPSWWSNSTIAQMHRMRHMAGIYQFRKKLGLEGRK